MRPVRTGLHRHDERHSLGDLIGDVARELARRFHDDGRFAGQLRGHHDEVQVVRVVAERIDALRLELLDVRLVHARGHLVGGQ